MTEQTQSSVTLTIPDFIDPETGVEFTEIEVTILSDDGDVRDAVQLFETLERPVKAMGG